jgi:hypothetical protein
MNISDGEYAAMGLRQQRLHLLRRDGMDYIHVWRLEASGVVRGFGGVPATVGLNKGTEDQFFQIGRFE